MPKDVDTPPSKIHWLEYVGKFVRIEGCLSSAYTPSVCFARLRTALRTDSGVTLWFDDRVDASYADEENQNFRVESF